MPLKKAWVMAKYSIPWSGDSHQEDLYFIFFSGSDMPITYTDRCFHEENEWFHLSKSFPGEKSINCHLSFGTAQFVDYQRDMFEDVMSVLIDELSDEDITFERFKSTFEKELQNLNTKLSVFAEKITEVDRFPVKGLLQVFFGGEYLASMIGGVGLMVIRDDALNYMMSNQEDTSTPINLFSELIEGEVKEYDEIITLGTTIDTYIDKNDFSTIRDISKQEEKPFVDALLDLLQVRVDHKDIAFVSLTLIESGAIFSQKKMKKNVSSRLQQMHQLSHHRAPYQGYLVYIAIWLVAIVMMWWIVQSFLDSNEARFVDTSGGVVVDFTIEDIQKDIAMFKRIDPSSDQKIKKYQEVIWQLDLLEVNNRRTNDVRELRKILESEYYKWFNIVLAHNDSFLQEPVYKFTQQEKNTFGTALDIFYRDELMIGGKDGVLLWAVNNDVRGTLVSAIPGMSFTSCSANLLKNGLYCATDDDKIYNIGKSGLNPVTNASWLFPSGMAGLGTFGSSNLYVLTNDASLNDAGTYVVRYRNQLGTQEAFSEGTEYILTTANTGGLAFASSGFTSFAIDGTFLIRSPIERSIYQLWRSDASANLQYREVELLWGDTIEPYSSSTKIISSADSRYVYLFDEEHQTFTVYRSTPYKTNDANTYIYTLSYFFRIKFAVDARDITDVFVDEGERSVLYLLTEDAVYSLKLYDYINTYFEKEAAEG